MIIMPNNSMHHLGSIEVRKVAKYVKAKPMTWDQKMIQPLDMASLTGKESSTEKPKPTGITGNKNKPSIKILGIRSPIFPEGSVQIKGIAISKQPIQAP